MPDAGTISLLIETLWCILPAYFANSWAVNVTAIPFLKRYKTPIDGGRKLFGQPLFGKGKTWRGLYAGVVVATIMGALQGMLEPSAALFFSDNYKIPVSLPHHTMLTGFLMGLGAMTGDLVKSFVKRRVGLERGTPAPLLDQLDFVIGAFVLSWLVMPINLDYFAVAVLISVPIHLFANIVAWSLKLKKVPW